MKNPGNDVELEEWLLSFRDLLARDGEVRAREVLGRLLSEAGLPLSGTTTPYVNSIPKKNEPDYPGDLAIEKKIRSIIRWNAMAMVVKANHESEGIGGHISTYASAAALYEVGFNHFFHGKDKGAGDIIYFQGHASPGIYARAFLEGRLNETHLKNFRRELKKDGGLCSYPHPRLMPDFWEFPTVSMGLGPIMAIYQARFNRYLHHRGLKDTSATKVWAFLGDGETDEPESLGALTLASRERLDNLIFVINCNLQRLDGPVRGNGKIIQELESAFRGAGWNVIKIVWAGNWDPLLENDADGALVTRMNEALDGDFQKYSVESGAYIREHFFGKDPRLLERVKNLSDDELRKLGRGGHDSRKIHAAFSQSVSGNGKPTVILAKTVKGYGLGESGEGKNVTHQQKKLNEEELKRFRDRFDIPVSDKDILDIPFYRPPEDSTEMKYLRERRESLGGSVPKRKVVPLRLTAPPENLFSEFDAGTDGRAVSTTMVFVKILSKLLTDKNLGKYVVPIVADEARTFGMEAMFRQFGIYSSLGQLYEPVDKKNLLYYHEAVDGQLLEEGITEAGSLSSVIAAGTSYATHGLPMIPFFIFYSMFGFQRVGDLIWAANDARTRGFLIGGTSGRTTLAGEGLQHQDGQSHLFASAYPDVRAYDPAFAFELSVIVREGIREMYEEGQDVLYYITVGNENYPMPANPSVPADKILKGGYLFKPSSLNPTAEIHLFGSGALLNEVLKAQAVLEKDHGKSTSVWSLTSIKTLYDDMVAAGKKNEKCYLAKTLESTRGKYVIVTDYVRMLPLSLSPCFPTMPICLGTDGYGLSETRDELRKHFKVTAADIVSAALS